MLSVLAIPGPSYSAHPVSDSGKCGRDSSSLRTTGASANPTVWKAEPLLAAASNYSDMRLKRHRRRRIDRPELRLMQPRSVDGSVDVASDLPGATWAAKGPFAEAPKVHRVCVSNLVQILFPLNLRIQFPC